MNYIDIKLDDVKSNVLGDQHSEESLKSDDEGEFQANEEVNPLKR